MLTLADRFRPAPWSEFLTRPRTILLLTVLATVALHCLILARSPTVWQDEVHFVDLLDLRWTERWDVAFCLDVLEHIPGDRKVFAEISLA